MGLIYLILIQEVGKCRMLARKIFCLTEIRIHILIVVVSYEGYVLRILFIQRHSDLEIAVQRAVEDIRAPWIHTCSRSIPRLVIDILVKII